MQIGGKDACVLVNGPVLNDSLIAFGYLNYILEPLVEKIYLEVKRPSGHVLIEIRQIRIEVHRLETGSPPVMFRQHACQRGLS